MGKEEENGMNSKRVEKIKYFDEKVPIAYHFGSL